VREEHRGLGELQLENARRALLVQQQIDARVAGRDMSAAQAKAGLLTEKQPSMEFVTPEQIGALAVFLCSEAASQIRGASYAVDGGWTAQ